eukprot:m.172091 g.172091  ORF g.172091 m.172091 type:complete len:786 (-) comp10395_c0_seq19:14-2371(-)
MQLPEWYTAGHRRLNTAAAALWAALASLALVSSTAAVAALPQGASAALGAVFSLRAVAAQVLLAAVAGLLVVFFDRHVTVKPPIHKNRLQRMWHRYLSPGRLLQTAAAAGLAVAVHLLFLALAGALSSLFLIAENGQARLSQPGIFGLFFASTLGAALRIMLIFKNRDIIRFPAVQQPRFFRFKLCVRQSAVEAVQFVWSLFLPFVPGYVLCTWIALMLDASAFSVHFSETLGAFSYNGVWLSFLSGTAIAFVFILAIGVVGIFQTQIPSAITHDLVQFMAALDCAEEPLLQAMAQAELAQGVRDVHHPLLHAMSVGRIGDIDPWEKLLKSSRAKIDKLSESLNNWKRPSSSNKSAGKSSSSSTSSSSSQQEQPAIGQSGPSQQGWGPLPVFQPEYNTAQSVLRRREPLADRLVHGTANTARQLKRALHMEASWLCPDISARDALRILQHQEDGAFVVHRHEANPNCYGITVVHDSWQDPKTPLHLRKPVRHAATHWTGTIEQLDRGFRLQDSLNTAVFPNLSTLVSHFAANPYRLDFAGRPLKLADMGKAGFIRSAPLDLASRWGASLERALHQFAFTRRLLEEDPRDMDERCAGDAVLVAPAVSTLAALFVRTQAEGGFNSHAISRDILDVIKCLLRCLAAISNYARHRNPDARKEPAYASSRAFSFESPLGTYLGSLRMALEMALSRLIRAFPQQTERALGSLEKSDGERLRSFLAAHEGLLDGMARTITQPHMPWAHSQPGPTSHGSPGPRSPLAAVGAGGAGDRWQSPPARSPYLRGLRT